MDRTDHLHDVRSLCAGGVLRAVAERLLFGPAGWANALECTRGQQRHNDADEAKNRRN